MRKTILLGSAVAVSLALTACATPGARLDGSASVATPGNSTAGTYLAANFAAAEGDIGNAAQFYTEMLKQDPGNPQLLERGFVFAASGGDFDTALPLAQRLVQLDPDNLLAHLVLSIGAFNKGDYSAVLDRIGLAGRGPFAILTSTVIEAWATQGNGRTDDAIKILDKLNGQMGVEGLQAFHKALILDEANRPEEAEAAYKRALQLVGAAPRASDAYGRFLRRQHRNEEAKAVYARVAQGAANPMAAMALAEIAADRTTEPLVSTPAQGAAEGMFAIAASLNAENGAEVAILYLNLALYLRPDLDLARALLGDRYERGGQYQMANEVYSHVSPQSPYNALVQVQSALNLGRMGKTDEAVAKMRALAAQEPNNPDALTALADLLRSEERNAEAIPEDNKVIGMLPPNDPRMASLYYARGIAYQTTGNFDAAENDFKRALELAPNRADVLNFLGYSWVDRGKNLPEAVRMLEKARFLRPQDGYIADSVGWAYYKLGRFREAAEILEEAVQLAPGASEMNDHLGDA